MRKKLLLVTTCAMLLLSGCDDKEAINKQDAKVTRIGRFIEINHERITTPRKNHETHRLVYDVDTNVMYVYIERNYGTALSPYYITNENGQAEIAVYGENYFKK